MSAKRPRRKPIPVADPKREIEEQVERKRKRVIVGPGVGDDEELDSCIKSQFLAWKEVVQGGACIEGALDEEKVLDWLLELRFLRDYYGE